MTTSSSAAIFRSRPCALHLGSRDAETRVAFGDVPDHVRRVRHKQREFDTGMGLEEPADKSRDDVDAGGRARGDDEMTGDLAVERADLVSAPPAARRGRAARPEAAPCPPR